MQHFMHQAEFMGIKCSVKYTRETAYGAKKYITLYKWDITCASSLTEYVMDIFLCQQHRVTSFFLLIA